jgi:ubiquinone/menaquinone biosynthesis C-methylase UbiE
MKIRDAYTRWADSYDSDRNLTRDLDMRVTSELLTGHYRTIFELGCGTGKNTALLSQIADRVVAADFSLGMLSQARAKVQLENVSFLVADLTEPWPCHSDSIQLVVCNLVLEHIQDLLPIFAEAYRVLNSRGRFFISELHPYRQYQGTQARFRQNEEDIKIPAFTHHISDFTESAGANRLSLLRVKEWWHENDENGPPRLISFVFEKASEGSVA